MVANPLRITVLAGGPSAERSVSLDSGRSIADALRLRGHDVFMSDINADDLSALDRRADVVFSALHGEWGEDGQLQRILESRGIKYVGSNSETSAITIDKIETKQRLVAIDIPTPAFELWTADTLKSRQAPAIPIPVIVKPVDQGSSVATTIVREVKDFPAAVRLTIDTFHRALVEQFITGDEFTVGILGGTALPPLCIRPKRSFYDFTAKYEDDSTEYLFDAGHPRAVYESMSRMSERIFAHLHCRHLARIDWMVDRDNRVWFLEVNTLPGFTSHSLVPKAAKHIGIEFGELCDRLVRMALES